MTARITLETPGDPVPQSLELPEGASIVVGREPVPSRPDARPITGAAFAREQGTGFVAKPARTGSGSPGASLGRA